MKNAKAANARRIGPMTEAVAEELRAELARQKRSAKNLAETAGLTRSTLHKTLNAQRAIDLDDLFELAELLEIDARELLIRAEATARRRIAATSNVDVSTADAAPSTNVTRSDNNEHPPQASAEARNQSDYDLVAHPYTDETGELMDE